MASSPTTHTVEKTNLRELIVYACPTGELAHQIESYMQRSKQECGSNAAHEYMPHITLTGFFHDTADSIPCYLAALYVALVQARLQKPTQPIQIKEMMLRDDFHGLLIESDWLKSMVQLFSRIIKSPTRMNALRLKDWLHLSLAYQFDPQHQASLVALAQTEINLNAPTKWVLRFYERQPKNAWLLHGTWKLA